MEEKNYKSYDELPLTLSVMDIAGILGISRAGAYDLAKQEDFPSFQVGKRILIPKEKFKQWIENKYADFSF